MSQQFSNPQNGERFESDTQKIIHRHLKNINDTISEDDIRSVRIGMTPPVPDYVDKTTDVNDSLSPSL